MIRSTHDAPSKASSASASFLASLSEDSSLFTLGSSVSKIVQIASDGDEAVSELTYFVLSDVALTQKILRLANTPAYRPRSGAAITTVSRAIFSLGFENVRLCALALLLVNGIDDKRQAKSVARELSLALRSSVIGRKLAANGPHKGDENVAIAALFKNFGALLLASYDHALYERIRELMATEGRTLAQACSETIGCSFESLAAQAMQKWDIPEPILHAATRHAPKVSGVPNNLRDWQLQAAAFSMEAAKIMPAYTADSPADFGSPLLARFGPALGIGAPQLRSLLEAAKREAGAIESGFEFESLEDLSAQNDPDPLAETGALDDLLLDSGLGACVCVGRHPSGKPLNSRDLLMAAAQDAVQMLASPTVKPGELILFILETLHTAMGFRFSTFCIRDPKTGIYRARMSMGEGQAQIQQAFHFSPAQGAGEIFQLAIEKEADLTIADARAGKIKAMLPPWHQALLPDAQSFIILPLIVQKKPIGFFYGDRALPAPEGVPPDEAAFLKMIKGQALAALRSRL